MCELCEHERRTEHKYEDDICWVAKCSTHQLGTEQLWMVVLRRHDSRPTSSEMNHMQAVLDQLFDQGWRLRGYMGSVTQQHWHDHIIEVGHG